MNLSQNFTPGAKTPENKDPALTAPKVTAHARCQGNGIRPQQQRPVHCLSSIRSALDELKNKKKTHFSSSIPLFNKGFPPITPCTHTKFCKGQAQILHSKINLRLAEFSLGHTQTAAWPCVSGPTPHHADPSRDLHSEPTLPEALPTGTTSTEVTSEGSLQQNLLVLELHSWEPSSVQSMCFGTRLPHRRKVYAMTASMQWHFPCLGEATGSPWTTRNMIQVSRSNAKASKSAQLSN